MTQWRRRSTTEQLFEFLHEELVDGRWSGTMPGVHKLAEELQVNRKTVEGALQMLEREGLLVPQGAGRRRKIRLPQDLALPSLRIAFLAGDRRFLRRDFHVDLRHELHEAGHAVINAPKGMMELKMDLDRIANMVRGTEADAWVVSAGPRPVLEWFVKEGIPVFALFGRRRGLPIAGTGPDKTPGFAAVARRLAELGHRRIVMLTRERQRVPEPGATERAFLAELEACGISPSSYNLPAWEESVDGFHACLASLFQVTPPTALVFDEPTHFFAAQQLLMVRGLRVPQDISMVCTDDDPHFGWFQPSVAHIHWNSNLVVPPVVRWAADLARGKDNRRQTFIKAELVEGGTMGPAPKERVR